MELPTGPRKAISTNPHVLLLYSSPKAGKTTICAQLPNSLLVELEPGGANYVDGTIIDIDKAKEFNELLDTLIANGKPYKYLIIDTVTRLDEWSEIVGTYNYMGKPQGKKFNRDDKGVTIYHTNTQFSTVHELPNGAGYQHSREVMTRWYDKLSQAADHIILLAHIKDKYIESKQAGDTVEATDINLTGKVKSIFTSKCDAIGHLYRRGNKAIINFNNENSITCGGRCSHLTQEIEISERMPDGMIKTYWDKIYLPKQ